MRCRISSEQRRHASHNTNKRRKPLAIPSRIIERRPDFLGAGPWRQHPQRYHDRKEAADVEYENSAFDKVELLRQERVEDHGEEQHGDDEQRAVPGLIDVPVVV